MKFVFIIARTPLKFRNPLRDELWELSKISLMNQSSKNWKAIIVGHCTEEEKKNKHFIILDLDEALKGEKIQLALNYLAQPNITKPEYLIRFDDDDIVSSSILHNIEKTGKEYDCCYDSFHAYIDVVSLQLSQKKKPWFANTVLHRYQHAITFCGPDNKILLDQDHSHYWHIYYKSKKVYEAGKSDPIYYRLLTPTSVTSKIGQSENLVDWEKYKNYLSGFGPWKKLPDTFMYKTELAKIAKGYFSENNLEVKGGNLNRIKSWVKSIRK